jgi:hypothetical protein
LSSVELNLLADLSRLIVTAANLEISPTLTCSFIYSAHGELTDHPQVLATHCTVRRCRFYL